jgi:hypothetical protein
MSDTIEKQVVPFTQIANEVLNSPELSFKAKGIYAFMMGKPDNWNFTIRSMSKQVSDGEKAIKSGIKELKELGYIEYEKHKDGTGTYHLKIHVGTVKHPKVRNGHKASQPLKCETPRSRNAKKPKQARISNKEPSSNKDSISNKDIHTEQAQTQAEIINSFYPNETSTNVLRTKCPKISKRQALDMIEAFKDKMNDRKAPWKDIQSQFRNHVRSGWVRPSVIDTTNDEQHKKKGTFANVSDGAKLGIIWRSFERAGYQPNEVWTSDGNSIQQWALDAHNTNNIKSKLLEMA